MSGLVGWLLGWLVGWLADWLAGYFFALSTKTECDYLNGWIKKRSHTQKSHPKVVNPRDIAGERKKTQTKKKSLLFMWGDDGSADRHGVTIQVGKGMEQPAVVVVFGVVVVVVVLLLLLLLLRLLRLLLLLLLRLLLLLLLLLFLPGWLAG